METTPPAVVLPASWADLERQVAYCALCPKMCRFSCPAARVRPSEALHPTGKADLILRLLRGGEAWSREAAEALYRCTGCMRSRTYCLHEIDVFPPLERARGMALAEGVAPESVKTALEGWEREGNPFGRDLGRVLREAVPPSRLQPEAQILVLAGCATLALNPGVLGDLARLLDALGLDMVGVLPPDPVCCGGMLLELGDQEGFRRAASALYARISRAKKVLTLCPHCLHTLKSRYGWLDPALGNRAFHISQFLLDCLPETFQPGGSSRRMIYHDPCVLGRHLGLYDPPRALLRRVLGDGVPEEYPRQREHAECCGGGGGVPLVHLDDARAMARIRLESAPDTLLPVATGCPWCVERLREAHPRGAVRDLVTVLADALNPEAGNGP